MWTREEKQKIVAYYRRAHIARCPTDRALLTMQDVRTGSEPDDDSTAAFVVYCPTCRQSFMSSTVELPPPGNSPCLD